MDTPKDTAKSNVAEPMLDPLRRVFIPIEKRMLDGNWRFRTSDKERYTRNGTTGTVYRADPKPLNKHARRRERANAISR